ncbi:MAG: hypothetical protein AABX90_01150 [Nanoarchaeota archaeon]
MLFVLVSLSFFLNFNGLQEITGSVTQENDPCVVSIVSNGINIGNVYVYRDSNGIVTIKEATSPYPRPFPAEFYPNPLYEGLKQDDGIYDVTTRQGERGIVTFSFVGEKKVYCS